MRAFASLPVAGERPRSGPGGFQIGLKSWSGLHHPADLISGFLFGEAKLVSLLQIHPKFGTGSEPLTKAQGRIRGDASLTIDDLGNAIRGNMKIETELMGIDPELLKFVGKYFARVNW